MNELNQISIETVRQLALQSGLSLDTLSRIDFDGLYQALSELVQPSAIGPWLVKSNQSLAGLTPLQVIERGESERIWRMIGQLREGNVGD